MKGDAEIHDIHDEQCPKWSAPHLKNRATLMHVDLQMDSTSLLMAWKFKTSLDVTLLVISLGAGASLQADPVTASGIQLGTDFWHVSTSANWPQSKLLLTLLIHANFEKDLPEIDLLQALLDTQTFARRFRVQKQTDLLSGCTPNSNFTSVNTPACARIPRCPTCEKLSTGRWQNPQIKSRTLKTSASCNLVVNPEAHGLYSRYFAVA